MDRPLKKKKLSAKHFITAATVLAILITSYIVYTGSPGQHANKDGIRFEIVKSGPFEVYVVGNGTVVPREVDYILPKAAGELISVNVKSGDFVEQGQTLFVFENEELEVEFGTREIGVAEAKAALAAQAFELETQKLQLQMAVLQAESAYKVQAEEHSAQQILMERGNSPVSMLDYRQSEIRTIQLKKVYELELGRLSNFENSMQVQLNQYEARLKLAENLASRMREQVNDLQLKAKKSGVIQDVEIRPGQRVEVGTIIGIISNPNEVYVRLKVSAVQGSRLQLGQTAIVEVSGTEKLGKVLRIDPNVKGTTIEVDIELDDANTQLRSNMFVSGRLKVMETDKSLYVEAPSNTIENGNSLIYVMSEDETHLVLKKVQTGYLSAGKVQIESGLELGDRIVVSDTGKFNGAVNVALH